jgi:hypothetical protein
MTLSEVAAFERKAAPSKRWNTRYDPDAAIWDAVLGVVERFEADPDFTLRARIEKLAVEWKDLALMDDDAPFADEPTERGYFARRLREVLNEKPADARGVLKP